MIKYMLSILLVFGIYSPVHASNGSLVAPSSCWTRDHEVQCGTSPECYDLSKKAHSISGVMWRNVKKMNDRTMQKMVEVKGSKPALVLKAENMSENRLLQKWRVKGIRLKPDAANRHGTNKYEFMPREEQVREAKGKEIAAAWKLFNHFAFRYDNAKHEFDLAKPKFSAIVLQMREKKCAKELNVLPGTKENARMREKAKNSGKTTIIR